MIELNLGMVLGFGLVLFTHVVLGLTARFIIVRVVDPNSLVPALKYWRIAFWCILVLSISVFFIAFAWTGIGPSQNLDQPQGEIDPAPASALENIPGENRPEERVERLGEGDKLQEKGQQDLESFRDKFFNKEKKETKP